MAEKYYSSLEVARMLDINPSRLARAVWVEKIPQPAKSPGGKGVFLWYGMMLRGQVNFSEKGTPATFLTNLYPSSYRRN